jgi:SAM-dependent methyltransferase
MIHDAHQTANLSLWNAWAEQHFTSSFYDVDGFRAGESSLNALELAEVGDVRGRSLLHLQCHFGLDTLSWARLGARVTGVDFSERAIELARALAHDTGIVARFVRSSVYELPNVLHDEFDVVFTSYGALPWLPDLEPWGRVVARYLKPGGFVYLAEFHPMMDMLGPDGNSLTGPYFNRGPIRTPTQASYTGQHSGVIRDEYTWPHPLSEVVGALVGAGLRIEFLHEHPDSPYGIMPFLAEVAPGRWMVRGREHELPLVYSIRAAKP